MEVINHNAVLATTFSDAQRDAAYEWVDQLTAKERSLFTFTVSIINAYYTVVLTPDGSKEGWTDSANGDGLRDSFITWLNSRAYPEDGSSPWDWIEVGWGEYGQAVLRGNCRNRYDDRTYPQPEDVIGYAGVERDDDAA